MRVFLSWSGERSHAAAEVIQRLIPACVPGATAWMSSRDIRAGGRWTEDLFDAIGTSTAGIVLLTEENRTSPWIMFEAGCLCEPSRERIVVPVLVDAPLELPGPLRHLQGVALDADGMASLAKNLARHWRTAGGTGSEADTGENRWDKVAIEVDEALRPFPRRAPRPAVCYLTRRDSELLKLLMNGRSTADIAGSLGVSQATARCFVSELLAKMKVGTVADLLEIARREGLG